MYQAVIYAISEAFPATLSFIQLLHLMMPCQQNARGSIQDPAATFATCVRCASIASMIQPCLDAHSVAWVAGFAKVTAIDWDDSTRNSSAEFEPEARLLPE